MQSGERSRDCEAICAAATLKAWRSHEESDHLNSRFALKPGPDMYDSAEPMTNERRIAAPVRGSNFNNC